MKKIIDPDAIIKIIADAENKRRAVREARMSGALLAYTEIQNYKDLLQQTISELQKLV